jgi:hypothetical protein
MMGLQAILNALMAGENRLSWCPAGPARDELVTERDELRDRILDARPRTDAELVIILSVLVRTVVAEVDPQGAFAQAARRVLANLSPATGQKPTSSPRCGVC